MTHVQQLRQRMPEMTEYETKLSGFWVQMFDQDDITRLVMTRRAVIAGYYSDFRVNGQLLMGTVPL